MISLYTGEFFDDYTPHLSYGINFDRGFIGMAYETDYNKEVQYEIDLGLLIVLQTMR